ncbi:MFS transporter [Shewanella sp. NFH-SH190041]|uniref:MFS transporter n=1 Tax=Shewanella sp. NFH-SH190041 TaxID=2950245 RepID=UPI0021C3DFD8|nr:MFS transporter [Shewanella sp. NFH-SH190041]BDM65178.1 MFS transporter [Shewanella sp. NFH-SH190041]
MPSLSNAEARQLIRALSVASVVIYINLYLMQGMLPLIAEHFHILPGRATLLLSATVFTLAFSLLLMAVISDRIGRRRPIVISLCLLALSNLLLIWATSFEALLCIRLGQGILLAAIPATAMAYFRDKLDGALLLKAAAVYIAANSLGGITGRLIGGLMAQYLSWHEAMWVLTGLTVSAVLLVMHWLPRSATPDSVLADATLIQRFAQDLHGFGQHLADMQLRLTYLIGALAFMVMVNQFSFIQLHLMQTPYSLSRFGATLIFLCYLSGTLVSWRSAGKIARQGHTRLFRQGVLAMLVGTVLTVVDNLPAIVAGFLITAWGFFLIHSCCNSFVAQRAQQHRAKATSLYLCCYYLGAAAGGPFLMPFWHYAHWQGVVVGSVLLLTLLFCLQWYLARYQQRQQRPQTINAPV